MKPLTLIVAMTPSGLIAKDGKIPWHVSEDMKRFKALTTGHAIVMGRKTYESIGKPLPNRTNIVVSRKESGFLPLLSDGQRILIAFDLETALKSAYDVDESPFVIGGGEIYRLALPLATKLEITYIAGEKGNAVPAGGAPVYFHFNVPDPWQWKCVGAERANEADDVEFMTFERRTRLEKTE